MRVVVQYEFEVSEEDIARTYYDGFLEHIKSGDAETVKHFGQDCVHAACSGGAWTLNNCKTKMLVEIHEK